MTANPCISTTSVVSTDPADSLSNYINGLNVTPTIISTAYSMPASAGANVKVGIVSLGGGWLPADLQKSLGNLGLTLAQNITSVLVDGAGNVFSTSDSNASLENTLDLYCIAGMVPSANIVIYTGQNSTSGFANVVNRAVNEGCDVITISWGGTESTDYLSAPLANASARGITVCAASGDLGSDSGGSLAVQYPASSPNVVAVGGTILNYNTGTYARFIESVSPSSGGGVSSLFSVPTWQTGLTANLYFTSNNYSHVSTLTGRGVPDVSAPFQTYVLWYNGAISSVVGTSASAPIIAGMFARYISLNGGRRPVANAVHKILYSNASAYFDLTTGNNDSPLSVGYAAAVGWDPVSGLGAPNGTAVYQMVNSGGTRVKTGGGTWGYLANVRVKTATNTWANVRAIWTKTVNGWSQTF